VKWPFLGKKLISHKILLKYLIMLETYSESGGALSRTSTTRSVQFVDEVLDSELENTLASEAETGLEI